MITPSPSATVFKLICSVPKSPFVNWNGHAPIRFFNDLLRPSKHNAVLGNCYIIVAFAIQFHDYPLLQYG